MRLQVKHIAAVCLLALGILVAGCSSPKDPAESAYKGPGAVKAGAPPMNPNAGDSGQPSAKGPGLSTGK